MATVFGLASGRYIPKGGRPDLLSPQGVFFPLDSMERVGNAFSHPDFDVLRLVVRKPGETSLQLVCGGPCIESLLRAHSSVIGMCRETIEAGTKSQRFK